MGIRYLWIVIGLFWGHGVFADSDLSKGQSCTSFFGQGEQECTDPKTILFGFRLSGAIAYAQIPGSNLGSNVIGSVLQVGPYVGAELVYRRKNWGLGFTLDAAPFLTTPEFLAGPPSHLLFGIAADYFVNANSRWIFGLDLLDFYQASYAYGGVLTLRGFGLRLGYHRKLSPMGSPLWEGFAYLSVNRFSEINVDTTSGVFNYTPAEFMGPGAFSGVILLMVGVQLSFIN